MKQYIGNNLDKKRYDEEINQWIISKRKVTISDRFGWLLGDIRGIFYNIKYGIKNLLHWRKIIWNIRSWNTDIAICDLVIHQLKSFIDLEQKYSNATQEHVNKCISSAEEAIKLIKKIRDPLEYSIEESDKIDKRYPEYYSLITVSPMWTQISGNFIRYNNGWVGKESGNDPRRGYFEFINNVFTQVDNNDEKVAELLEQLDQYYLDKVQAYRIAEKRLEEDQEKLIKLFKQFHHMWWD